MYFRLCLLLMLLFFSGCSESDPLENTYVIANGAEPTTFDPALVSNVTDGRICRGLFEGLVALDPKDLQPVPGCASWTMSGDGLKYTFTLRKNLKWSNGEPLLASDFTYAWQRILQRRIPSSYASLLFCIKNAELFYQSKLTDFNKVGIKVISPTVLQVELTRSMAYFPELLAYPTFYPVNKKCVEQFGTQWTRPENMVSNGAFKLSKWLPRQRVELVASEHYYDYNKVSLSRVRFLPYDNLNTTYLLFVNNQVDWLPSLPMEKVDEIKFNYNYYVTPYLGTYFYRFNCEKPPFDNPKVRAAFSLSIDRTAITGYLLKGGERATPIFCPPIKTYKPTAILGYDVKRARKLLLEAGYDAEHPFPKVDLSYNTSGNHKKIAESLVGQWQKNLGIDVGLKNSEWKTFLADQKARKYDLSRSSWIGDYNDPETFYAIMTSTNGNNRTGWKNENYDQLLEQSKGLRDLEKRNAVFAQMETILNQEQFPILPIYYYVNQGLLRKNITGWYPNIQDLHPLKFIKKQ